MFDEVSVFGRYGLFSTIVRFSQVHDAERRRVFLEHSSEMLARGDSVLVHVLVEYDVRFGFERIGNLRPEERD